MTTYDNDLDNDMEAEYIPPEEELPSSRVPIPIGEVETKETMVGVVAITRSLNLGTKDNNIHLRVELPFQVQPGWDWQTIAAVAADACYHGKAVVYEQLGLAFTVDEGGVLRESIRGQFPDAELVEQPRRRSPERSASAAPRDGQRGGSGRPSRPPRDAGDRFPHPRDLDQPGHVDDDTWDDLCDNFDSGWFDNRPGKASGQYKANASDFVRKEDRHPVWLKPFRRETQGAGARGRGYDN